jgi:hypothetical protein
VSHLRVLLKVAVLTTAVVSLAAAQPPMEASIGTLPTPAIVGMSGPGAPDSEQLDFYRWALQQGGLTVVSLVLIAMLYRELRMSAGDKKLLMDLVEKAATAHAEASANAERLARAIELRGLR